LLVIAAAALLFACTITVSDEAAARGRGAGVGARGVGVGAPGVGVARHPAARAAVRRCAAGVTCY
jgi:hypothetical protein